MRYNIHGLQEQNYQDLSDFNLDLPKKKSRKHRNDHKYGSAAPLLLRELHFKLQLRV